MGRRTLGIIGSGNIGTAVASLAVDAGLEVVLSNTRGPASLTDLVAGLGQSAHAGTVTEAIAEGHEVVVAIPFFRYAELPADAFTGQIVIDTMNFDPGRDHAVAALLNDVTPSQLLQRHLGDARVVKAFSNIHARHITALARVGTTAPRTALPIAGNDAAAKRAATSLLDLMGFDALDAGSLADTRRFDLGTPAFVTPYLRDSDGEWWTRLDTDPGAPLERAELERLLAAE